MKNSRKKRYTIAIMTGDTQSDFSEATLRGFFTCAREEDVNVIFLMGPIIPQYCKEILEYNSEGDYHHQFNTIYDYIHFTQADALIVTCGAICSYLGLENPDEFLEQYAQIPYVLMQRKSDDEDVPYVIVNNYDSMKQCVEHLAIHHGYKRIAFLSGPRANPEANERLQAYRDVMKACGNPVTDTMIAYGNYSENADDLVRELFDSNPGLEAIVCANDNMAKCCYRICAERNLLVGRDIAITGFDDVEMAREMDPPLTSVAQNAYAFSYTAVKYAVALCEGKEVDFKKLSLPLHVRCSCGCEQVNKIHNVRIKPEEAGQFVMTEAENIAAELLEKIPYESHRVEYTELIKRYFSHVYTNVFLEEEAPLDVQQELLFVNKLLQYQYISNSLLIERFQDLFQIMVGVDKSPIAQTKLSYIIHTFREYSNNFEKRKKEEEIKALHRKAWFVPSFTRDLNRSGKRDDYRDIFIPIMKSFQKMNVKSCYVYLFPEPVIHKANTSVIFPRSMYLTAYYNRSAIVCYNNDERPRVTDRKGFSFHIPKEATALMTSVILFSGDRQYGLMLCEVEKDDISFMHTCGLQIGSLLRYLEMNWTEQEAAQELQNSLQVIQEQNRILSFVSDYDELSGVLNRRGFMEQAIARCTQKEGEKACVIFCDVDHLKEINDCYGHSAGDFAISKVAAMLRESLPDDAIIARIGGDEFVTMLVCPHKRSKDEIVAHLKEVQQKFNDELELPYYVEFSIGVYQFYCSSDIDISDMIQKSDGLMYQAKKNRRASIRKE